MSRKTSWVLGCLAVVSVFGLLASPAQASLIIGFNFTDGSTNVVVPSSGGTYTVNVVASVDNPAVTSLGIWSLYYGALSTILNSNLGNATLDGDITAQALNATLQAGGGVNGDIGDVNGDSRNDMGPLANTNISQQSPGGSHPWWTHTSTFSSPNYYANAASAVIGTFTVTIPAYTPNGNMGNFLKFGPNLQVSVIAGNYDFWGEITSTSTTNRGGKLNTATGVSNVNLGTAVMFQAVPEPATFVLLGLGGLGLMSFCWRKR